MQVAGGNVDGHLGHGADHRLAFNTPDVGIDVVVDRGPRDDPAELQLLVLIVEAGEIELQGAEGVLRSDLKRVDEFGRERFRNRENRRQGRVDTARFVAARVRRVDQVVRRQLVIDHRAPGKGVERGMADGEFLGTRDPGIVVETGITQRTGNIGGAGRREHRGAGRIDEQRGARLDVFLIVVVAQAQRQLELVVELEVGLPEDAVGVDLQVIRIVAVHRRCDEIRIARAWWRKARAGRAQRPEDAGRVVEPERADVIAVLGQVQLAVDAADQEVEHPVPVGTEDGLAGPA